MSVGSDQRVSDLDDVLDEALQSGSGRSGLIGAVVDLVAGPPAEAEPSRVASDLFAVVDALEANPSLRRALTDPSTLEDGRRSMAPAVLDGRVGAVAVEVAARAAAMRWPGGRTMAAALDRQAVRAQLTQAE